MSDEPRSRNANATREAILSSARLHFLKDGYDNAGVRAIATDAGIDPALICRYFGSKRALFGLVLEGTGKDPMEVFEGERSSCGARVASAMLDSDEDKPRQMTFLGLVIGAMGSPEASTMAHEHIERQFIDPVSLWLGGDDAKERAWMLCSLLIGVVIMKNIQPTRVPAKERLAGQIQRMIDSE
jgi:AcrR family transcriptional regulator